MLTVITGAPGAGKTAYVVAQLQSFVEANPERPVFVMGVPELTVRHELTPPVEQWTREVAAVEDAAVVQTEFAFPEGALVVIDEAQKVFRPRGVGSRVPGHVAAFETHRHQGLDFWLVTQHPNLIDANIRKLVRKHVHLRQCWAGRELLEWSECSDPNSRSDRDAAVRRPYRLPKAVFGLYKSASMHVRTRQRVPWAVWVFLGVSGIVGVLGWRFYGTVSSAIEGEVRPAEAPTAGVARVSVGSAPGQPVELSYGAFVPRLLGRPESAPLYDEVRKVVAMPAVAGCMASRSRCTCVTEQGSNAGLSDAECRAWLAAPPFSPFRHVFPDGPPERVGQERSEPEAPHG
ncbi:MAG: zonular occludens toxin [Burkholderiales bacterium]|nr:zonular occludens toxin [Burkholderiales bacterium]